MRIVQITHTASGLQHILGCVVFLKLHPQEVLPIPVTLKALSQICNVEIDK